MVHNVKFFSILFAVSINLGMVFNANAIEYIQYTEENIAKVKKSLRYNTAHPITVEAYVALIKQADKLLTMKAPTVIDKTLFPKSNRKNDYLSISRYWWPDPNKKDGLPWIRKDGITNPSTQNDDVDRNRLGLMTDSVKTLSLAYYFSTDEKYAKKAIELIDTWFLNRETRMNPHLKYAQSVPGNPKGRRSGILDGRLIPEKVLDALGMLSISDSWTAKRNKGMNKWLKSYLKWLVKSDLGKAAATQTNNHGSWYRFQIAALAWYLEDDKILSKAFNDVRRSFNTQFNAEGAQIHELERTRAFFYSTFNLSALTHVAAFSSKKDLSLWDYRSSKGYTLQNAVDYLLPVAQGEEWPHNSQNLDVSYLLPILKEIIIHKPSPEYKKALVDNLHKLATQKEITKHQLNVLYDFALYNPEYLQ